MITPLETITAYLLWAAILIAIGMRIKDKNWKELFKIAAFLGFGFFLFVAWKLEAATAVHNLSGFIFDVLGKTKFANWAAVTATSVLVLLIAGAFWWFLTTFAFKNTSGIKKWLLWILTLLGAFTALILFVLPDFGGEANVNYLYVYGLILIFHLAIMLILYWEAELQNSLAIPIAFAIMLVLANFMHRLYFGCSVVDQYKTSVEFWISFMIMLTVIGVITYVFYKRIAWFKRWSRYIIQIVMVAFFVSAAMFMAIQFRGGYHAEQVKIKVAKNAVEFALLSSEIKDVQEASHNGLTFDKAQEVALKPEGKTTAELKKTYEALVAKDEEASKKMQGYTGSETVLDKSWKKKLGIFWPGNWKIGDTQADAAKDFIIVTEKSFIIDCPDGKPSKFYRTSTNNLNFFFNKGKDHFYLQLRSGKKISLEELKRKRAYIGTEDFRIVPTKNKPLDVGVEIL
ncbi:hypothetical protein KAR28_05225 [Candidatus Parcubacteria bacterium]|nr:hypothetical protein [Candidatus Parcubacteria bacterium]